MTTTAIRVRREQPPGLARTNTVRLVWVAASVVALVVAVVASVALGSKSIPFGTALQTLIDPSSAPHAALVVRDLRVPRTVLGILVGVCLGTAGMLIQGLTRNPLADPGILGVNAGASLFVVVAIAALGVTQLSEYLWFSFAGAILATVAVYAVGSYGRGGGAPIRLTLAGVGIGAVLEGISSGILLLDTDDFYRLQSWGAGSIAGRPLSISATILPFVVVGLVLAAVAARELNVFALGDDLAKALGGRVAGTRVLVVVAVTLLVGAATAAAGPIAFVGLMVPHVARWVVGPDQRWIFALSLVLAPILLLVSDVVGRLVLNPAELPVGVVTAFIGAPVLIALVRRAKASAL